MLVRDFNELPERMKTPQVKAYYDMLGEKRTALFFKRFFDVVFSLLLLVVLSPAMAVIALLVKLDSKGPVFFRQRRVTANLRVFGIFKFRTMIAGTGDAGPLVTAEGDSRITSVGRKLRPLHLDELPQLLNVLLGDMSFVGTRPEVEKYIHSYTEEMYATLLLPGGMTSTASLLFWDEARLLKGAEDTERAYTEGILPQKMLHNLQYMRDYTFFGDIKILLGTLFARRKRGSGNG